MEHLRDAVAMVLQKNTLFSGTLLSNLKWGKENASMEEWKRPAGSLCADEFIQNLPKGYETEIGTGGVNVSRRTETEAVYCQGAFKKAESLDPGMTPPALWILLQKAGSARG